MKKKYMSLLLICLSLLCACSTKAQKSDINNQTVRNENTSNNSGHSILEEPIDKEQASIDDNNMVVYDIELKPLLDSILNIWGRTWYEWTVDDFLNEKNINIPHSDCGLRNIDWTYGAEIYADSNCWSLEEYTDHTYEDAIGIHHFSGKTISYNSYYNTLTYNQIIDSGLYGVIQDSAYTYVSDRNIKSIEDALRYFNLAYFEEELKRGELNGISSEMTSDIGNVTAELCMYNIETSLSFVLPGTQTIKFAESDGTFSISVVNQNVDEDIYIVDKKNFENKIKECEGFYHSFQSDINLYEKIYEDGLSAQVWIDKNDHIRKVKLNPDEFEFRSFSVEYYISDNSIYAYKIDNEKEYIYYYYKDPNNDLNLIRFIGPDKKISDFEDGIEPISMEEDASEILSMYLREVAMYEEAKLMSIE